MRKVEIVDAIIDNTDLSRAKANEVVDCIFTAMGKSLVRGENIYIRGFATFKTQTSKPKKARNISNDTEVLIPACKRAKLVLCKKLKALMNK